VAHHPDPLGRGVGMAASWGPSAAKHRYRDRLSMTVSQNSDTSVLRQSGKRSERIWDKRLKYGHQASKLNITVFEFMKKPSGRMT
jgi:hypothetical protein